MMDENIFFKIFFSISISKMSIKLQQTSKIQTIIIIIEKKKFQKKEKILQMISNKKNELPI